MTLEGAPFGSSRGNFFINDGDLITLWIYVFTENQNATLMSHLNEKTNAETVYSIESGEFCI